MKNFVVTVGIPVKNAEKSITRALESILEQDFPHEQMQLIIVDDGCTDITMKIVNDKINKIDIQAILLSTGGKGLGVARQTIVNHSKGKYILWVDADMTLLPNYLSTLVKKLDSDQKIGKVRGLRGSTKTGTLIGDLQYWAYGSELQQKTESKIAGIGGSLCRTEAIKQIGGFDLQIKGAGEDVDLATRMLEAGWTFSSLGVNFYDSPKTSSGALLKRDIWYGYGGHYLGHKFNRSFGLTLIPPIAFVIGIRKSILSYKIWHVKQIFLMPLMFSTFAFGWWFGFVKAHFEKYQPV